MKDNLYGTFCDILDFSWGFFGLGWVEYPISGFKSNHKTYYCIKNTLNTITFKLKLTKHTETF